MSIALIIISFIVALFVIILIHELAHFITARRAKVKVEEFGIGFPPRLWGIKRGETIYSVNAIPIGAFVKTTGENDPTIPGSLASKGPWTRLLVYAAGPLANILLGFILISAFFMLPTSTIAGNGAMVHSIGENSPAEEAGIKPGDIILELNAKPIHTWKDMQNIINSSKEGEEIALLLQSNGSRENISLEPKFDLELQRRTIGVLLCWNMVNQVEENSPAYEAGVRPGDTILGINEQSIFNIESLSNVLGLIEAGEEINLTLLRGEETVLTNMTQPTDSSHAIKGVELQWVDETRIEQSHLPGWRAFQLGASYTLRLPLLLVEAIPLIKEDPGKALVGPIGAGQLTIEVVRSFGSSNILFMASIISLGIGLFNFLPMPPLDGGGMLIAFIEGVRRGKRLSQRAVHQAHRIGTAILLTLMILITFNDILRLVQGGSFGL